MITINVRASFLITFNVARHDFVNLNMKLCFDKKLLFDLMFKFNIFFMSI